ncbi:MAG: hypothetical protein U5R06_17915 [candidate division KSB1 bacterium]|nr:hypothetical protein [candidate division KSB1 bacterium]
MAEKCFWCSKESSGLKKIKLQFRGKYEEAKICGDICEKELQNFVHYANSHIKHYITGLILSILFGLIIAFWRLKIDYGALGVLIICAGSGFVLIKYPFVTPQTVTLLGAKKAIASGRILGLVSIALGIIFWFVLAKLIP